MATTHSSLSPPLDDSALPPTAPQSAASVFTPPPHSAVDVILPEGEPLFAALSSPPVMITHTPLSHSSLPHVARDPRVQSLPASDVQLLPDASDAYRFSSHLSIDTRASSSHTALLHASPSAASPPLVSSPPITPAYGSDDGQMYQQHRTRRQRRHSPSTNTSHTASIEVTPASSTSSSTQPSPHLPSLQLQLHLLPSLMPRPALSPSSSTLMCEFCEEEIAEWYCCQCTLGMCERHREEGHSRLYPNSGGHQLLELSGHKEGMERRRREKEEAERREQVKRQQEDEMRYAKRKQLMRTDSAALSPFAALQSLPASAAEEALRAEIEQDLQHIAEQRNVEEALMAAAKRADGRTSTGSGQGGSRAGAHKSRVLDTPSITHRFVPLITKQDVVDNWSRLMDDVSHLYPKPKPKRSGRRTRTPASGMSDVTAGSSPSAVLPPQHESNSVQLSHILPIASRLGGRSVSAVSPSQRRSAIARISCTPSPPLSPLRRKLEDEEKERRRQQQAEVEAQHARIVEDWRQQQQRARVTASQLNGYHQSGLSVQHNRHYSLAHNGRQELDESSVSPRSSTSSSRSTSMRRSRSSIHLPQEQLQLLFTQLPPAPPADRVRSHSSPPKALEIVGKAIKIQRQRQPLQQQKESMDQQTQAQQQQQEEAEEEEEVQEEMEEVDEDVDAQSDVELHTMDEKEFLPPAPPALHKQYVVPSHRHELDFSADEIFEEAEERAEDEEKAEESSMQYTESATHDDDSQRRGESEEEKEEEEDEEEDDESYSEYDEGGDALPAQSVSFGDGQLVAEWRRANEQQWESQHSNAPQSEYVQYRDTATQTDEQRITQAGVHQQSREEQEESMHEYDEEDVDEAAVQVTPLRARAGDMSDERTPYAQIHRTPMAAASPEAEHEVDERSDSDEEEPVDEDDEEELQQEGSRDDEQEEEEQEDINDGGAMDGSLSEDEHSASENAAEPMSQTSLSPRRSPASSFEWHDQDLDDAMWMKSSTDSPQRLHLYHQRRVADALQLLPSALPAAVEAPLVSLTQHHHRATGMPVSRLDEDVVLLAQTLQRILNKRDGRPSAYPPLPSFSRHSKLERPHHSASTSPSASVRGSRHRLPVSDVPPTSSFSRVPLPPHAYPRTSPPVYPVSLHSHSQRLPSHSSYLGQQRADQQPAASTSSSSRSSTSHMPREWSHSSSQHSRRGQSFQAERTARVPSQSPPASIPNSPSRSSSHPLADSRPSSASSSSTLDLSHGALRRLDRMLLSHVNEKKQPNAQLPATQHRMAVESRDGSSASGRAARRVHGAGDGSSPRIVHSTASAITVQLKAAHSFGTSASMEHHNSGLGRKSHHRHERSMSLHVPHHLHLQQHQQRKRKLRDESSESVSLASRAYQSMRAVEQHGSRRVWHE